MRCLGRVFTVLLFTLSAAWGEAEFCPCTIHGHLHFTDGRPIEGAELSIQSAAWSDPEDAVLSGTGGEFRFTNLKKGSYVVAAQRYDFGTFHWRQSATTGRIGVANVGAVSTKFEMDFAVEAPAIIAGTVRDTQGQPVSSAQIQLFRLTFESGRTAFFPTGFASTHDDGTFRSNPVPRGTYRVCVVPTESLADLPVGTALFAATADNGPKRHYVRTCYPERDGKLRVAAGENSDLDIILRPAYAVKIRGTILNLPEKEGISVQLSPIGEETRLNAAVTVQDDGAFEIQNVPSGNYWILAQVGQRVGREAVTVDSADIEGVRIALNTPIEVTAIVHDQTGANPPDTIALRSADAPHAFIGMLPESDGKFRFQVNYPGRFWLVTRGQNCPGIARYGEADVLNSPVVVTDSPKTLDVTFTAQCGNVNGSVVADGKPVPFARNLILLSGTPDNPGDFFLESATEDGKFSYTGLPPGTYSMWAWTEDEERKGLLHDLTEIASRATKVEIKVGGKTEVTLAPLSFSGQAGKRQ